VSPHQALAGIEEISRRLAGIDRADLAQVDALIEQRAAAIQTLVAAAPLPEEYRERLRQALDDGELAMHELRLARAAARASLSNLNGALFVLRGLSPEAEPATGLVDWTG